MNEERNPDYDGPVGIFADYGDDILREAQQDFRLSLQQVKKDYFAPRTEEVVLDLNYMRWPVTVEFDYTPPEPMAYDYPGILADVDIVFIKSNGIDIQDALPRTIYEEIRHQLGHGKSAYDLRRERS